MSARVFDRPRIVTWSELQAALLPRIQGYAWAMGTLHDLWKLCTPTPDQILIPNHIENEKRIIMPGVFASWWADVCQHQGLDLTANRVVPRVRTH